MRIFRCDAANGVDNVINLSIPAGERMGQRDVREGVVGTVPADLKFIIGQLKVMKTYVLCLCRQLFYMLDHELSGCLARAGLVRLAIATGWHTHQRFPVQTYSQNPTCHPFFGVIVGNGL